MSSVQDTKEINGHATQVLSVGRNEKVILQCVDCGIKVTVSIDDLINDTDITTAIFRKYKCNK